MIFIMTGVALRHLVLPIILEVLAPAAWHDVIDFRCHVIAGHTAPQEQPEDEQITGGINYCGHGYHTTCGIESV